MATSTIPALKAALLTRLINRAGLAGVSVTWGRPPGQLEKEWIMLGNCRNADPTGEERGGQSTAVLGRRSREERYVLEVDINVIKSIKETAQSVTERAFVLLDEIEDELRADPTVNATVRTAQVTGVELLETYPRAEAGKRGPDRGTHLLVDIACAERI